LILFIYNLIMSQEMEQYFREALKEWCYDEVKRKFYNKYNCYGFMRRDVFYYSYDLDEYKQCCPKCIVF